PTIEVTVMWRDIPWHWGHSFGARSCQTMTKSVSACHVEVNQFVEQRETFQRSDVVLPVWVDINFVVLYVFHSVWVQVKNRQRIECCKSDLEHYSQCAALQHYQTIYAEY